MRVCREGRHLIIESNCAIVILKPECYDKVSATVSLQKPSRAVQVVAAARLSTGMIGWYAFFDTVRLLRVPDSTACTKHGCEFACCVRYIILYAPRKVRA